MITISKALFLFHYELISGPDNALSNVMKEEVAGNVRLPLLQCYPHSAQQVKEGHGEQDGQVSPDYRRPGD